jgi:mRNA interferase MazF
VTRGEIWTYRFKAPDKRRPVLILTRPEMISVLNTVTVAALTRTIRGVASEVVVGEECGLKERSAINLHQLFTIPQSGIHRFVGSVSDPTMRAVRRALLHALAFEYGG